MDKIKIIKTETATFSVSNARDGERAYDISALATLANGAVESISGGTVAVRGNRLPCADFQCYGNTQSSIYDSAQDKVGVFAAINGFVNDVKAETPALAAPLLEIIASGLAQGESGEEAENDAQ